MSKTNLKILILEDNPYDAELNISSVKKEDWEVDAHVVDNEEGFVYELEHFNPDIILSDYNLPRFNGLDALEVVKEKYPFIPFIIVTGSLDEETAVDCIKKGAWDYVLKEHLVRLNSAVKYALQYRQEIEQRKQAEIKIRESEKLSRKLLDNIKTGVFLVDLNTTIVHCNSKAESLTGRQISGIRGQKLLDTFSFAVESGHGLPAGQTDFLTRVVQTGEAINSIVIKMQEPDRPEIWFDACVTPVVDDKGHFDQMVFCISDITEKIKMQANLRESQSKYEAVFNSVNDGIFLHDINDFTLIDVNDTVVQMYGYNKKEIKRLKISDLSDKTGGYTSEVAKDYAQLAANGKPQTREWLARHRSGRLFWVHVTLKKVKLGSVNFVMALVKDIDKQKRAEMSLHESEEQYKVLSQNTPDVIMRYDRQFRHLFVNDSVRDLFGIAPGAFLNKSVRELGIFHDNLLETWEANLARVFTNKRSYEVEFTIDVNGTQRYVEWRFFPEFTDTGDVSTVLSVARDITDRKVADRKLRESEEMLHLVFDNIPLAVFWKDRNSVYLGGNRTFIESAGLEKPEDLAGKTDYDLPWQTSESDFFVECDQRVMDNDEPEYHIIEERKLGDGTFSWNDTNKIPLHDEEGKVIGILGTAENITEKKKSQEALSISEERLKMALEASNDGLWDWNRENNEMYFSPRYFTMLGYEPGDFDHNPDVLFKLIHPDDTGNVRKYLDRLMNNKGGMSEVEMRLRRKDDSYAWIHSKGKAFQTDKDGQPIRLVGTHVDITLRKRHEDIQEVLFEIANSATTTRNLDELFENIQKSLHKVIDTTNCYVALYNSQNDKISLPFHRDEKDNFQEFPAGKTVTAYVIRTGQSQLVSLDRIYELEKSGEIEPIGAPSISWLGVPLRSGDKIIGVFVVQSYDEKITYTEDDVQLLEFVSDQIALAIERKMDQDNVRENQERLRKIIESSPDGLVVIDVEGGILDHNSSFPDMVRMTPGDIKLRNFFEFITPADVIKAQNTLHDTLMSGYQKNIEFRMRRADDTEFYAETSLGVIHGADTGSESFVIVVKNINERKAYEFNLKVAKEKAEESDRLKTAFLSNMSHEIRTPMNAIIGFAELLSNHDLTQNEKTEFIQQINNGADSLMRLIDDIIDIAKIEAGQIKMNNSFFEMKPLLKDLKTVFSKYMSQQAKESISLVEDHTALSGSVQLYTDEFRLRQIFTNLLSNAIKFTDEGEIHFGIKRVSEYKIWFYVSDTGIGISEESCKVIFERFRQGHESKTKFYGGTGLGLAIS
ncbi:MAG TPA: PAS domain S-box protein, partial [Bacteroidales bacterium]|nr:PAS domain S-box protein [Bacteroidales bacterium]